MKEENKKENIKEELERADKATRAAIVLSQEGLFSDAVSRMMEADFREWRLCQANGLVLRGISFGS
ncbi:MAG: hypothetical protein J7J91_05200 [Deltaproteobacteria bacterium]|nr:hypothetical protein [Deltaproteobacteria bacterium]